MKKTMIILATVLVTAFQTVKANDERPIPYKVKTAFENLYTSSVEADWRFVNDVYIGSFNVNNERFTIYFNEDAELIGTGKLISADNLPSNVKAVVQSEFEGYHITQALQFFSASNDNRYFAKLENDKRKIYVAIDEYGNTEVKKTARK